VADWLTLREAAAYLKIRPATLLAPASDAQSRDWLKCRNLCVRASLLAGKGMLPSEEEGLPHRQTL
jgi:hypothetical protein